MMWWLSLILKIASKYYGCFRINFISYRFILSDQLIWECIYCVLVYNSTLMTQVNVSNDCSQQLVSGPSWHLSDRHGGARSRSVLNMDMARYTVKLQLSQEDSCTLCVIQYVMVPLETYLQASADTKYNPDLPVSDQVDCLAYDSSWEFPKECLKFGEWSLHHSSVTF